MKECYINPITRIFLPKTLFWECVEHGSRTPHKEVCGLLTGVIQNGYSFPSVFYPIKNIAKTSGIDYLMDPKEYGKVLLNTSIVRPNSDIDLTATFHTHPASLPVPSSIDKERAVWNTVYLILNPNQDKDHMMAWYWNGNNFTEIKLDITI